jgi:hypothetical protein
MYYALDLRRVIPTRDPLRTGVPLPGLRSFCVARWGRVAKIGGRIAGCAHPLEKSAPISGMQAYIAYFLPRQIFRVRLSSAQKTILVTFVVTL